MNLHWDTDILGRDYQCASFSLGNDPVSEGNEGEIFGSLVRHLPHGENTEQYNRRPALLFVHGMTDYFFHRHVAEHFYAQGFAVYALDLRKCGRSHRKGQTWHYASHLSIYFQELDIAAQTLLQTHPTIVPIAHSTGGLIVCHWLNYLRISNPLTLARFPGAILNSPWLSMMAPAPIVRIARPLITMTAKIRPRVALKTRSSSVYGKSLHIHGDGEWDYNLQWKPFEGHKKFVGWVAAVDKAQRLIHQGRINCGIPLLCLSSDASASALPLAAHADAVINVEHISQWGPHLSEHVSIQPIPGAKHDVFLSSRAPLAQVFQTCDRWLDAEKPKR
ncbi:alpha/beta hydrolase [Corynebacterium pseudotuberculosis]|uniref:Alpha/beta fold hydrolase n=1 Tax=Corynebacterium pseudotuberculosis 258 TaxID=1168865 RepID=A0AAU8PXF4_CORPS|nr:alpha/beta hydrolase [Corynebacterium pseudotuberculosis]AER69337.1 Lysophospholipase L2 [Corynebacterium pseudotuberculosis 1/06-A]AEQ06848.1 alpha/beta fold hydrolase [Corynebacterium pseudotuberculosis CIP 52.97]AFB72648.1 alpha/beta fold hydrolase [Corynebacterium pseudotuberculosis 316]AFK16941.1 alpha/beta fold hydrolase [Corynebacterium pseudotuberculosis 258]AKN59697.1 alpha/beta fold hydrolase [Corynebacterium pseudotuberculosis 31]